MLNRPARGLFLAAAVCFAFAIAANAEDAKKPTTATTPDATTAAKPAKKPPSECKGLDETTCATKSQCTWRKETTLKDGKTRKAHCRKKSTPGAKKPKTTTPATTTPAPAPKT